MRTVIKLLWLLFCLVIILLVYDLGWKEFGDTQKIAPDPVSNAKFTGRLLLGALKYDTLSRSIRSTETLEITSVASDDIRTISFTPRYDPDDTKWLKWTKGDTTNDCSAPATYEVNDAKGTRHSWLQLNCGELGLPIVRHRREIWYPFDYYEVSINPRACANDPAGACLGGSGQISFESVEVELADQNLIVNRDSAAGGGIVLKLHRRLFVRLVSVIFLVLALVFLVSFVAIGDAKDLLQKSIGFFAALWGLRALIVPTSVSIFPTIVDYAILSLFCLLFFLVLLKLAYRKEAQNNASNSNSGAAPTRLGKSIDDSAGNTVSDDQCGKQQNQPVQNAE
jgi:hypothetical protein